MTAAAYAVVILILAGCCAWIISVLAGREQPVRSAVVRARWAWACRKPPARTEGKLNRADYLTFVGLVETWRQSDAPERTPT